MAVDDDPSAAVARRKLGRELRALRLAAQTEDGQKITAEHAAKYMERARPTLYRIEEGLPGVSIKNHDITALAELYKVDEATKADLLALAAATRVKGWFARFSDVLPPGFDMYVGLETAAASVWAYEGERVHGLLQTEEYAREILRIPAADAPVPDDVEIERRVAVRMRRQEILTRADPPAVRLTWVLGEAVLHRPIGGPAVMAHQLRTINEVAELPNVTVRVIPFNAGLHYGIDTGPFAILRFPDNAEPPTAYMDNFTGHLLTHKASDISRFDAARDAIQNCALDEKSSRELIHRAAKEPFGA
ncbi:helix-turn-helix domain-containing protein [Micromonospora sp. NPDC050397]|uniref:helix-turn-helix domain-containing protein n=1 Tax=Micromonospora sp. NPDC050397 TaxID=3364279 RepID=UPI00384BF5C0